MDASERFSVKGVSGLLFAFLFLLFQPVHAVEKYKVHIQLNFVEKTIKGSTEIFVGNHGKQAFEFPVYGIRINSVKALGKHIPFTFSSSKLKVDLPKGVRSFNVNYEGTPSKGLVWGENYVYTNYDPCTWMICFEEPGIRAAIEIEIDIPEGMKAIANGDRISKNSWSESRAYSSYLYGFAVGNFEVVEEKYSGFEAHFMGIAPKPGELKKKFKETEKIVRFFESKSGVPLPLKTYTQVLVPGNEAQEKQGFALLGANFVDPILVDPTEDWVLVHEVAHQWWGNSITCKTWDHFWLNEGLVVFMTAAYKQFRWGQAAYDREMELAQKRYRSALDAQFDVPLTFSGQYPSLGIKRAIVYSKGALFLDALRKDLGEEAFWKGIKAYTKKFHLKSVESQDFQFVMEQASQKNLKNIFAKWVY